MRPSIPGFIAILAILVAYSGFVLACPKLSESLGLDLWNYSEQEKDLREATATAETLEQLQIRTNRRQALRRLITQGVIDGRENLAGATEQFMYLNQLEPEITSMLRGFHPSKTDEEAAAFQVVRHVRAMASESGKQSQETIERVEADLIHFPRVRPVGKDDQH